MKIEAYKLEEHEDWVNAQCSDTSAGNSQNIEDILSYLLESTTLNICWDLDTAIIPLLKKLTEEQCKKLAETNKCFCRPFRIFYIPGKVFAISAVSDKKQFNLYQIKQYFPEEEEPEEIEGIKVKGLQILEALAEMGMYPEKLTSPVAIYEQSVMKHLSLPDKDCIPKEAAYCAWQCSGKLWIEAFQVGYFEQTWDYDIVASFPSVVRELYDLRHCYWANNKELPYDAVYGYCECKVTIWAEVSPIIYVDKDGRLTTPTGTWRTYLTLSEIEFIQKWDIGKVEIVDGWWAFEKKPAISNFDNEMYPFQVVINRLLKFKDSENKLVAHLAKQMAVGVYGKFGEEHKEKFGKYFNPVYFAEISTKIRLAVAEFIYKHELQDNLIHVSVDGILVDKEIKL